MRTCNFVLKMVLVAGLVALMASPAGAFLENKFLDINIDFYLFSRQLQHDHGVNHFFEGIGQLAVFVFQQGVLPRTC